MNKPYKISKQRRWITEKLSGFLAPGPKQGQGGDEALTGFNRMLQGHSGPEILEIGTRVQEGQALLRRDGLFPNAKRYVGVDYREGEGVDIVVDAHCLTSVFEPESFDGVQSLSTFEHIKYPWVVAHELAKVTRIDGYILVQTLQTFALHGSPYDYWRFSASGLRALFPRSMGLQEIHCNYSMPCLIVSGADPLQVRNESYMSVSILLKKVEPTPASFQYDFDGR